MSHTEAVFVPKYLPSNMTDEEFVRAMGECLPREIVARMEELEGRANDTSANLAAANADKILSDVADGLEALVNEEIPDPANIEVMCLADFRRLLEDRAKLAEKLKDLSEKLDRAQEILSEVTE